jgi:predicted alpha/beta superfamily hydrolase
MTREGYGFLMGQNGSTGVGADEQRALMESSERPASRTRRWALTLYLLAPLAVLAGLCWAIVYSLEHGVKLVGKPHGAGAGATGGANAIGELLAGNKANASAKPKPEPKPEPKTEHQSGPIAHAEPPEAGTTAATEPAAAKPAPKSDALVRPESLEQGFILIVQDKSGKANADSPIFMAGNFNNWNPADPSYKLTPQSDMKWRIEVARPRIEKLEFKFTRGSWELEELKDDMSKTLNRTLEALDVSSFPPGEKPRIELSVSHWGDELPQFAEKKANDPYRSIGVGAGTLKRLQVAGGAGEAKGRTRDVLVWLPPGYDAPENAGRVYPVLYMHDGQNVFDKPSTAPGEWRADETAAELIAAGRIPPLVIVGVPHSGRTRVQEYLPSVVTATVGAGEDRAEFRGEGDAHVAWLANEVMPRVERAFRVSSDPSRVGVGGSSMGGLIALHAGASRPDKFGLVLAESPALGFGKDEYWKRVFDPVERWPQRIFLAVGGREGGENAALGAQFAERVRLFDQFLEIRGLDENRRKFVFDPEAAHRESAWAKRLPEALAFLFPPE